MGKEDHGESGSVEVIMPDGFGSSFSTKEIRAKVIMKVSKLFRFLTRKKIYVSASSVSLLDGIINWNLDTILIFFPVCEKGVCYSLVPAGHHYRHHVDLLVCPHHPRILLRWGTCRWKWYRPLPKVNLKLPSYCIRFRRIIICILFRASPNGFIVYIVSYVIFFVTYLAIACCESVRRKSPANLIAMGIFTLALSVMTASIAIYHDVYWVLMAIGITAALCLGLTLFSFQTKIDFTGIGKILSIHYCSLLIVYLFIILGMYLFAATWILFIFGILAIVFFAKGYPVVHTVYSALIALLFSVYLIYDTQQIMGGKKYEISPEEHIYASVQLYIDVVYIFLAILSLGRK